MERVWSVRSEVLADSPCPQGVEAKDSAGRVALISVAEAAKRFPDALTVEVLESLPHAAVSYIERDAACAAGIVVIPTARRPQREARRFAFIVLPGELVLVEDGSTCAELLDQLQAEKVPVGSAHGAFVALVRLLLRDHPAKLSRVREDFELIEELILEGRERVNRSLMREDARRLLGIDGFYQGLTDILGELADEGEGLIDPAVRPRLAALARQVERLSTRLEALQDYCLQVQALYQESIDIRQNNVMQWLTVVTTIAMPLTFITGWYGMNFPHMALFDVPWGYIAVVAVCAAIVVLEIAFFHRQGWLSFGGRVSRDARGARGRAKRATGADARRRGEGA